MLQRTGPRAEFNRTIRTHPLGNAAPWFFGLALTGLVPVVWPASAQPAISETPIEFSISEQPLVSALRRYGNTTGREAIYDASLARGRKAGRVQGVLTPTEALEKLLAGTGLSARVVADDAFVLFATPTSVHAATMQPRSSAHRRYYALIQESLLDVLCRQSSARPSRYRIVAEFGIAQSGAIENARRIGSTGIAETDRQIDAALRDVRFSEPPPAGFAQPVRILIVPNALGVTPACASADARFHATQGVR